MREDGAEGGFWSSEKKLKQCRNVGHRRREESNEGVLYLGQSNGEEASGMQARKRSEEKEHEQQLSNFGCSNLCQYATTVLHHGSTTKGDAGLAQWHHQFSESALVSSAWTVCLAVRPSPVSKRSLWISKRHSKRATPQSARWKLVCVYLWSISVTFLLHSTNRAQQHDRRGIVPILICNSKTPYHCNIFLVLLTSADKIGSCSFHFAV